MVSNQATPQGLIGSQSAEGMQRAGWQAILNNFKKYVEGKVNMHTHKKQFKTIEEYIETFTKDVQSILEKIRQTIQKTAPGAVEAISYQIPTFKLNDKNLVHFAAFKNHIGFYPTPSIIEAFKKELSQYKGAKGSVQFPLNKPIPYDLLEKIVMFRAKEILKR